jgi:hypothetical protein
MNFFEIIVDVLVNSILQGERILELFNQYFLSQTDANKVLMLYGVAGLTVLGSIVLIKTIVKKTAGLIKFALIAGFAYYIVVVVMGIDLLGFIFSLF